MTNKEAIRNLIEVYENCNIFNPTAIREYLKPVIQMLENTDIRPVVYTHWKKAHKNSSDNSPEKLFTCSKCKGLIELPHYAFECYYKYCPNCGAKIKPKK